ncbi:MAG: DoxX family membrane protein [Bacteroidales bacterium]|nr:DoxX family membrane protein [Bacteroidales bacterium]MCF8391089.1 DoxX family membrane protein [Bacteroidales bacterium]
MKRFFRGINQDYSNYQLSILVVFRVMIGWHFLYEGITKILNPNWTSVGYLLDSGGLFSGFFKFIAASPELLKLVDFINIYGLTAIGLGLILGLFTQLFTLGGMLLLAFYYLSHPPIIGFNYAIPSEGNYLFVNKTLIEMAGLWVLYLFPTSMKIGLDTFIFKVKN